MNRVFVRTHEFDKCWGNFGLTANDIIALEEHLCVNPQAGVVIPGTGGLRKLRWPYLTRVRVGVFVLHMLIFFVVINFI